MKRCPDCNGALADLLDEKWRARDPREFWCLECYREWMVDDDGNLYDPSDPPGPLWSSSLREHV